ncbi:hydroxyacid dehydrogenase [Acidovorax sp. CCYZU-2555]|uniref:hydroxyacid dehydrogenase n=1 Tax=Acidovorax sp. CCYZU-2555 TaxID=2835042 RepID=UPI001BCCCDD8|nr:hydroxyacid dehydrogenase [Acidovorax sp. CCYZU-2555]MBS7781136.1 hydroxyacid dehydrogenase [Acidovorax sp. CCYZU-2555]
MNTLKPWRVARFDVWINPVFDERLSQEPSIALDVVKRLGDDARTSAVLRAAHVYQITAAKDELPLQWHATQQLLEKCPQLLCVSSTGAGYDTVDVDACTAAGVAVVSQIGGNAPAVAEMALGLMLAVSRRIVESDRKLRTERGFARESLMGHDIGGKVLGLVGIGHAGAHTAKLARAFGMQVVAVDPLLSDAQIRERGAEPVSWATLAQTADIVSLHCPRDASTLGLFNAERFAAMKKGALFISTARGGIHDELALAQALRSGHLAGAGLDVWQEEPPALDHPLLALANVVATFHTAGVSHEGRHNVASMAANQLIDLLRGERPARLVNPEVWETFARRRARALAELELTAAA